MHHILREAQERCRHELLDDEESGSYSTIASSG
jgi:hypothetical protein